MYNHTQVSFLWIGLFGVGAAVAGHFALQTGHPAAVVAFIALLLVLLLMPTLTVRIQGRELVCYFGPGLIRRSVSLRSIEAVRVVRNAWYYGWGIRLIPQGWMWNIAGLGAVELKLSDGTIFRIGSDQPEELERALMSALNSVTE